MKTFRLLVFGVVVGLLLAGIATALVIPLAPQALRGQPAVWAIAAVLVLASIAGVFLTDRAKRPPE